MCHLKFSVAPWTSVNFRMCKGMMGLGNLFQRGFWLGGLGLVPEFLSFQRVPGHARTTLEGARTWSTIRIVPPPFTPFSPLDFLVSVTFLSLPPHRFCGFWSLCLDYLVSGSSGFSLSGHSLNIPSSQCLLLTTLSKAAPSFLVILCQSHCFSRHC